MPRGVAEVLQVPETLTGREVRQRIAERLVPKARLPLVRSFRAGMEVAEDPCIFVAETMKQIMLKRKGSSRTFSEGSIGPS